MSEASARLGLPWILPGQAQKELAHNEALQRLDLAVQPAVQAVDAATPPPAPVPGQCWALGPAPTGAWSGQGGRLAGWTEGGWRFVAPTPGFAVWSIADALPARWTDGGWSLGVVPARWVEVGGVPVLGARRPAIADPAGGATVDAAARTALSALLAAARAHGLIAS